MDDKKIKEPEIRFTGFEDDWKQHKLGELGTVQTCKRIFKEQTFENGEIPFYKNGTLGLKPDSYISREKYEEFKRLYPYPEVGDILISVVGSIGKTAEYTGKDEYFQDSNVVWLKTDGHINKKFLKTSYQVINWLIEGSTIKHLYNDNILRSEIKCPKSQIEQQKIGEHFQNLDNLITLHQRELELLKQNKKAMLQKMFPKNGSNFPEIRFAGFNDAWKQHKVLELLEERNELSIKNEKFPLMAFIANKGVAPKGDRYDRSALVNDTENKLYKRTERGDFIYSSNNLETGSIGLNDYGNAVISPVYSIFKPTGIADPDFIGKRFVKSDFINSMIKWRQGVVYGQWRIHENDFLQIDVMVPTIEEQRRIGDYFRALDNLITHHQRELDLFIKLKKSMLQKMFI